MVWFRAFAWAYGIVCFALVALLPLAARAQLVPAPPVGDGSEWAFFQGTQESGNLLLAPPGFVLEYAFVGRSDALCSQPLQLSAVVTDTGLSVYPGVCYSDDFSQQVPDPEVGVWYRFAPGEPEEPEPPASAASSPAATEATALQISSGLAVLAFLVVAGLGFMGYSVGARDA